eukprot:TRINITY_DN7848_c0_g1_i1.p2 TRINITY_DN7848_c0_g1~~TRINITY_DN7848_c0_g1_i1.p2  ORF type:complete len:224 (+),score=42.99 TRINITY_DN7848_c0_g1_i1:103-774(+)
MVSYVRDFLEKGFHDGSEEMDHMFDKFDEFVAAIRNESVAMYTEPVKAFVEAVDWSETFFIGILAVHVLLILLCIIFRNNVTAFSSLFLSVIILAALSQPLNMLGGATWERFSETNYFDPSGLFITGVWGAPLCLLAFFMLLRLLVLMCTMMVKVKRMQLRSMAVQASKAAREDAAATGKAVKSGTGQAPSASNTGTPAVGTTTTTSSRGAVGLSAGGLKKRR